jgi:hypothetical protein
MADRMAAEIWVGGKLPRRLLDEFPISDLRLDWDGTPFDSTSEQGILIARDENGLLHFADYEIAWGEFQELEGWLREHALPFQRRSSGKYSYDPCFVEFRPDLPGKPDRDTLTTQDGSPVIYRAEIEQIVQDMAGMLIDTTEQPIQSRLQAWGAIYHRLRVVAPPALPPLPTFEFVDG